MGNAWVNPKIIIGNTALGEYYFRRPFIEESIWDEIQKGNHVLIAAPRRVGKSSVMQAMLDRSPVDTRCIFKNIQGIKSETEYYEQFYKLLVQCLDRFGKGKTWIQGFLGSIRIEEITMEGVKFGDKKEINFAEAIKSLLAEISKNKIRVVLLLDELPEVLNSLHRQKRDSEASHILNHLRELRQNPGIRGHLNLVLAGSVGIQHVVKAIEGRIADLNDFNAVPFEPLSLEEAKNYVAWATDGATVQYDAELTEHLLNHIRHFIPYFINLMLDEINKLARKDNNPVITTNQIDAAFALIVKNSDHFKEWKNRLGEYFPTEQAAFLNKLLICIAHEDSISQQRLYDLAVKHGLQDTYMELVRGLEHDGYLLEQGNVYRFVSPFLQAFWKLDNPIYSV
ncbi:MAG: hypothetical protein KDC61_12245 [Saprospiraceae bacterium]|nr:hypothetical protein [Saprospiraceae bacterium]MCB0575323.1 hypothetical protein [Saprospiraceae bacterium]MCB9306822.1 hypothetical protein [Lewinellaceae bacterium]MCB9356390.1 hypothetical protein [Lewinellaceae bacterium]